MQGQEYKADSYISAILLKTRSSDGRTVSSGSWTKNGNMITLNDSRGRVVSEMVFEFVEEPSKTPHLKLKKNVPDDNLDFTQIDYDFAWCVDRYR